MHTLTPVWPTICLKFLHMRVVKANSVKDTSTVRWLVSGLQHFPVTGNLHRIPKQRAYGEAPKGAQVYCWGIWLLALFKYSVFFNDFSLLEDNKFTNLPDGFFKEKGRLNTLYVGIKIFNLTWSVVVGAQCVIVIHSLLWSHPLNRKSTYTVYCPVTDQ